MHEDGEWVSVSSSNVDAARRVGDRLEVRFRAKGRRPARTWKWEGAGRLLESLVSAPSAGKYVHHVLRKAYGDGEEVT